jgi:uncharacterized phage-associated protein
MNEKIYTPTEISDWILSKVNTEAGDTISPLKLQKLLFYCQAYYYSQFKKPLFKERIEAWAHGPVEYTQFKRFENLFRNDPIRVGELNLIIPTFDKDEEDFLNEVIEVYGEHSAHYLERLTHRETPWKEARGSLEPHERSSNEITLTAMSDFYSKFLLNDQ